MTDEPMTVAKYGSHVSINTEQLREAGFNLSRIMEGAASSIERVLSATPEQRAEWARQAEIREAESAQRRADERAQAAKVPLTLDELIARLDDESGWDRAYLEHLVQPYCGCGNDIDGWSYCQHARDEGLAG